MFEFNALRTSGGAVPTEIPVGVIELLVQICLLLKTDGTGPDAGIL